MSEESHPLKTLSGAQESCHSGSQAPEPSPLCPRVPEDQGGSERLMALLLKQLAPCTLVSP